MRSVRKEKEAFEIKTFKLRINDEQTIKFKEKRKKKR